MIQDVKGIKRIYREKINPYVSLAAGHKPHGAGHGRGGVLHSLQLWETAQ